MKSLPLCLATLSLLLLGACAQQRINDEAQTRARAGDYDKAAQLLDDGVRRYPDSATLRSSQIQLRNEALARLVAEAATARAQGRYDDAQALLERAARFDSNGQRTRSLLADLAVERRQREALDQAKALAAQNQLDAALKLIADALKDNRRQPDLVALQRQLEARVRQQQTRGKVTLAEQRPISLDFRDANLRAVLDVVTRHSGINFILDKDIRTDVRVSVYLRSARLEDAIDLIASTHGLAKKVLDDRTVVIYPNSVEKQREYQEQVIRVFHLGSADAKGAAAFLRSMIRIKEPFVDDRANLMAIRESPENVELAERLVALYDTQEPEVLLELEVIEVRSSRLLDLGIKLPDALSLTLIPPTGGLTLGNYASLTRNDVAVGIGGAILNFKREVGDFNTLANPRIRAKNREKARVLIGDKVPVITATTGTGGFVSDSVNYLDVGLKLDVEPTVYPDDEVAIRVALEVSSVAREVRTASGTLAYQVGTRNASTMLRLRDGETQLLAGLISHEDRSSASRLPGLGDLPIAGRLFSAQRDENSRTELVLAITPRILRNVRQPDASEAELWVGTEANTRLRPPGGRPITVEADGAQQAPGGAALSGGAPRVGTGTGAPVPVPAALQLTWRAPKEAKVGEVFTIGVDLNSGFALRGAPLRMSYDKERLALIEVQEGDYFKQGQVPTNFTQNIDSGAGRADFGILRGPVSGTPGRGSVVNLTFRASSAGTAELSVRGFEPFVIGEGNPQASLPPPLKIEVKP
jgi:general secretion pathway protein D